MCFHSQLPSYLRPPSRPQASAFPLMRSQGDGCPGRTSPSLPLAESAVLNDTPVACQTRGPTDPQGDRCPHIPAASAATYPLRCFAPQWARFDNRHSTSAPTPTLAVVSDSGAGIVSRPGASVSFVSDGPISSNSGRNGGKNAGRNYVSALPQRATPVHCHPRFPSRNRRFPDRCRSPDCASTAFRCRCLLLRQKLFVLPCRRLRNNYIRAQRAHLPLPPCGGKGAI